MTVAELTKKIEQEGLVLAYNDRGRPIIVIWLWVKNPKGNADYLQVLANNLNPDALSYGNPTGEGEGFYFTEDWD